MAADRRVDLAGGRVEAAPDEGEIFAFEREGAPVVGEQQGETQVGRVGLGDDEQAGRVLVEPVDDAGPPHAADPRQARPAMADERVDQRALGVARRRMDDEARRLVDDDEMFVLVDDVERKIFADQLGMLWRRRLEGDSRAFPSRIAGSRTICPSTVTSPASISALRRVRDRATRRSEAAWPR